MQKENKAIENVGNTCCNCLKEGKMHNIHIGALGWGSGFDNFSTQIDLCEDCYKQTNPKWWELKICGDHDEYGQYDTNGEWYEYENEIFKFIKQMPLAGQELFWARYAYGACATYMSGQDWIDYQLDTLPHEKCKEYGYYSPQEIAAYHDRFPNCKHVEIRICNNGSKSSQCFNFAFGDKDGNCGLNISNRCYLCDYFKERSGQIKVVDDLEEFYKREEKRLNNMITYATKRLEIIKNKTLT